ncbi:four-carbon acid sugar kinase family protein [Devosia neptuniae]|uniref:Four-carbon acid sugar kinase family protein n=1 Tax=Devosia neptuniae TaxID=191302 RepID=A0ABY6CFI5_9HYPH|nr:four-carbon acid sugar kinase family protein [Devosia neptuniae]UXN71004.1 four-carbon acid sugar kinase family protein [Devosia neptuniae]
MTRLVIIADDLTGALDASAPFAMRGLSTVIALDVAGLPEALASGAEIVGVSTDSREIAPEAARAAVADVVSQLPPGVPVFKKIDSRLKGNIAAELDAIPHRSSLVVPAIPAFGRWVRKGQLGGFGLDEPIDVAARLGTHAATASIPDAASQEQIAAALRAQEHDLLIGARGLAEALAEQWSDKAVPAPQLAPDGPVICVIGSTDPITVEQAETLRKRYPGLAYIAAPNGIAAELVTGRLTLLQAVAGAEPAAPAVVAVNLARVLQELRPATGTALVLSGGATAQAILEALGIGLITLVGEALPGLPIARAGGFTIITKSGGFGDKDTLVRLLASSGGHEWE